MADSKDKPETETLGYNPNNANCAIGCECAHCTGDVKPPKPLKRGFLGLNAHVIKPETRVNKAEDASQHLEQPNQNLMIIEEIEGLISQVNDKLGKLKAKFCEGEEIYQVQAGHRSRALEEIDLFQKTTLFELRRAFE